MPMPNRVQKVKCALDGCDIILDRRPYQLKRGKLPYCSRAHAAAGNRGKIVERTGRPAGIRIERPCSCGCGRMVSRRPCEWRKSDKQNGGPTAYYEIQCHNRLLNVPGRAYTVDKDFVYKRETRPCAVCSAPVIRMPCDMPPPDEPVFCALEHSNQYINKRISEAAEVHKICANPACPIPGGKFTVMKCESFRRYCSKACMGKDPHPDAIAARSAAGIAGIRAQSGRPSSQELLLGRELTARGIPHEAQVSYEIGCIDFLVCGYLYVCVDGEYWHNYPDGTERDHRQDAHLAERGFPVLRFWCREIDGDIDSCVERIISALKPI